MARGFSMAVAVFGAWVLSGSYATRNKARGSFAAASSTRKAPCCPA